MNYLPKISIILTTYNGKTRGFLHESIKSVFNQTYIDYECLIIDDGSNDNTFEDIKPFLSDHRFLYFYQKNKGLAAARNTGIGLAKGLFICFLDDDDIWDINKLNKQINFLENHKDYENIGMVYTNIELIDSNGNNIGFQSNNSFGKIYEDLLYKNLIDSPSSVMIKNDVFKNIGYFKEWMKSSEDYDLWFRISKNYLIYSQNEFLVKYRLHNDKMSYNHNKMDFYTLMSLYYATEAFDSKKQDLVFLNQYKNIFNKYYDLGIYHDARKYFFFYCGIGRFNYKLFIKLLFLFVKNLLSK